MTPRWVSRARALVTRSRDWPILGPAYRAAYAVSIERARRAFARPPRGVRAVLLRGSAADDVVPGVSDIDLYVVLENDLDPPGELDAQRAVNSIARSLNRPAPLFQDVHVVTRDELEALASLSSGLLASCDGATPLYGDPDLPQCVADPETIVDSLVREVAYWTARGIDQLAERNDVGGLLARRSFDKALRIARELDRPEHDVYAVMRSYARTDLDVAADVGDAVSTLAAFARVLPAAPELRPDARATAPEAHSASLRAWLGSLLELPGLTAALWATEGPRRADRRLYVTVDPALAATPATLAVLLDHMRHRPLPAVDGARPRLMVTAPSAVERAVLLRDTFVEPALRDRFGVTLHGNTLRARLTPGELRRSILHVLTRLGPRLRDLATRPPAPRDRGPWDDALRFVLPTARQCLESDDPIAAARSTPATSIRISTDAPPEEPSELYTRARGEIAELLRDAVRRSGAAGSG